MNLMDFLFKKEEKEKKVKRCPMEFLPIQLHPTELI